MAEVCEYHGCVRDATHTARICKQAQKATPAGEDRNIYADVPYCTPHVEEMRVMRFVVTPIESPDAA